MIGNVWEWCIDLYDSNFYSNLPKNTENPVNLNTGQERVLRGGAWCSSNERQLRSATRGSYPPGVSGNSIGFRLARTVQEEVQP